MRVPQESWLWVVPVTHLPVDQFQLADLGSASAGGWILPCVRTLGACAPAVDGIRQPLLRDIIDQRLANGMGFRLILVGIKCAKEGGTGFSCKRLLGCKRLTL